MDTDRACYYVGSGQKGHFAHRLEWLPVSTLLAGQELAIPMMTIEGCKPGPVLGLAAGVHGDEHTGTEVIRRVLTEVDRSQLSGVIRAIPVVNPLAFAVMSRCTPLDSGNLNRVFPGSASGMLTEQMAFVLDQKFLPGLDYLIDFHGGGLLGHVEYSFWVSDKESSLAAGARFIYDGPTFTGTLKDSALKRGVKAATTLEYGGIDCSHGPGVREGVRCVRNLMKYWGMLPGSPELPEKQYIIHKKAVLKPRNAGILYQHPENAVIGRELPRGALLGVIVNPYTFQVVEELTPPFDRNVVFHIRKFDGKIDPGEYAYQVGDLDSSEIIENPKE